MLMDNSISCFMKIIMFQNDGTQVTPAISGEMIGKLPLMADLEESQSINEIVFEQVINKNQHLLS